VDTTVPKILLQLHWDVVADIAKHVQDVLAILTIIIVTRIATVVKGWFWNSLVWQPARGNTTYMECSNKL